MKKFFEEYGGVAVLVIVIAVLLLIVGSVKALDESTGKVKGSGVAGLIGNKLSDSLSKFQESFNNVASGGSNGGSDNNSGNTPTTKSVGLITGQNFNNTIPDEATAVEFTDEVAPQSVTLTDVSTNKDNGVVAWLDGTTYKVSTQQKNVKIGFNESCRKMFYNKTKIISINFNNVDTNNVTDMNSMFNSCEILTSLDLSNFDTSKVTDMNYMFSSCEILTSLDLSNFDTSKVTNMSSMFCACQSLTTIYVSNLWSINNVTKDFGMFIYATKLVGQSGTKYDLSETGKSMANYQTGYLTYKAHN